MITKSKVRKLLTESAHANDMHITMDGDIIPFGCPECVDDIDRRIDDISSSRNKCSPGTAARGHYSGVLHQLRKDRRAAGKIHTRDFLDQIDVVAESAAERKLRKIVRQSLNEYSAYGSRRGGHGTVTVRDIEGMLPSGVLRNTPGVSSILQRRALAAKMSKNDLAAKVKTAKIKDDEHPRSFFQRLGFKY